MGLQVLYGGVLAPLPCMSTSLPGNIYMILPLLFALRHVSAQHRNTLGHGPGMHETHCKHSSLIFSSVFNNNSDLLICGCLCTETQVHIPRHKGRMSSNNNKIIGLEIYNLFVFYQFLSILCYFCSLGGKSGCMNSGYGDMRYKVYRWGFHCLDYFFDVLIS